MNAIVVFEFVIIWGNFLFQVWVMLVTCLPVSVNSLTYFHLRIKMAYVPHPQIQTFNVDVFEAKMVTPASNTTCMTIIQENGKWFNTARTTEKDSRLGLNQNNTASQIRRLCLVLLSAHCDGHSGASEPCHGTQYVLHGVFWKNASNWNKSATLLVHTNKI
jgi:hypothetical protein